MTIKEALVSLNPEDDSLWTEDDIPTVEAVQILLGDESITRAQITEADPAFYRNRATQPPASVAKDREPSLEEQLHDLDVQIEGLLSEQNRIAAQADVLSRRRGALQTRIYGTDTSASDTQGRIDYIRSQNALRAARVAQRNRNAASIDMVALTGKAPIDQVMTRKNTRGTQRPVHVLPKPTQE
jgi:hypothetical protein